MTSNIHLGGLEGHGGLQMASFISEVKFDLRFETSSLKYPDIHVHIASGGHLQKSSEVKADLKIELSDLNYQCGL